MNSFDFRKKYFYGQIWYICNNFKSKKLKVIAYISNLAFFGCSQSCLCMFFDHVHQPKSIEKWAIPEKIQTGGIKDIIFWKNPWNFSFFYFIPGNSRQNKAQPLDIPQNCVRSLGNSKTKNKDPWKFHIIFSWSHLEIPLCF